MQKLQSSGNVIGSLCTHDIIIIIIITSILTRFRLKSIMMIFLLISLYSLIISLKYHDINTCLWRRCSTKGRKKEVRNKWLRCSEYERSERPSHVTVTKLLTAFAFSFRFFFGCSNNFTWVSSAFSHSIQLPLVSEALADVKHQCERTQISSTCICWD